MSRRDTLATWTQERLAILGDAWPGLPDEPERVVLGFDGSQASLAAGSWAAQVAGEVHVVTALDISAATFMPAEHSPMTTEWVKALRDQTSEHLPDLTAQLGGAKIEVHTVESGPARALIQTASKVEADLIIVGHASGGMLDRLLLGSVAEALVHHDAHPVLVARERLPPGPILAGIGGQDGSQVAAAWAVHLADVLDRELILAHAADGVEAPKTLDDSGPQASIQAVPWPAKEGIKELAEATDAALLVVGHRPGRRWLGSTAISVIRHAPCSVLVGRTAPEEVDDAAV